MSHKQGYFWNYEKLLSVCRNLLGVGRKSRHTLVTQAQTQNLKIPNTITHSRGLHSSTHLHCLVIVTHAQARRDVATVPFRQRVPAARSPHSVALTVTLPSSPPFRDPHAHRHSALILTHSRSLVTHSASGSDFVFSQRLLRLKRFGPHRHSLAFTGFKLQTKGGEALLNRCVRVVSENLKTQRKRNDVI